MGLKYIEIGLNGKCPWYDISELFSLSNIKCLISILGDILSLFNFRLPDGVNAHGISVEVRLR